jgi:hypothetical protein
VEYSDWRIVGGLKFESGQLISFVEVGGAIDREVDYERVGTDFDVDSGFFGRLGVQW